LVIFGKEALGENVYSYIDIYAIRKPDVQEFQTPGVSAPTC
jgi:hypothetical protein